MWATISRDYGSGIAFLFGICINAITSILLQGVTLKDIVVGRVFVKRKNSLYGFDAMVDDCVKYSYEL